MFCSLVFLVIYSFYESSSLANQQLAIAQVSKNRENYQLLKKCEDDTSNAGYKWCKICFKCKQGCEEINKETCTDRQMIQTENELRFNQLFNDFQLIYRLPGDFNLPQNEQSMSFLINTMSKEPWHRNSCVSVKELLTDYENYKNRNCKNQDSPPRSPKDPNLRNVNL